MIYELHVRGFTAHPNAGVVEGRRGTFAGLIDKIPYLVELGVTMVALMPVFQFDPGEGNYWGYNPISFFAPNSAYAYRCGMCDNDTYYILSSRADAPYADFSGTGNTLNCGHRYVRSRSAPHSVALHSRPTSTTQLPRHSFHIRRRPVSYT